MISHTHFASLLEASASIFPPKNLFVPDASSTFDLGDAASKMPAVATV